MTGLPSIVLGHPSVQVGCHADIALAFRSLAFQKIHVPQSSAPFAAASEDILLRAWGTAKSYICAGFVGWCVARSACRTNRPSYAKASEGILSAILLRANCWGLSCEARSAKQDGGEDGIRTHEKLLTSTPLAGERLRPLGHLSVAPLDKEKRRHNQQAGAIIAENSAWCSSAGGAMRRFHGDSLPGDSGLAPQFRPSIAGFDRLQGLIG